MMGDKTGIEYLDATWSPAKGCSHVSLGCDNCWAERQAARFCKPGEFFEGLVEDGHWSGAPRLYEKELRKPLAWKRPRRIGVCFMGDLFHEEVSFLWIDRVFAVMESAKQHTFLLLTKRPLRMLEYLSQMPDSAARRGNWPLRNVWLGTSVEDQETAVRRIPALLRCPAALHYVSVEPMLGPVDLTHLDVDGNHSDPENEWCQIDALTGRHSDMGRPCPSIDVRLDWVVAGGESGPGARPTHPLWVYDLQRQCEQAWIPYWWKQWGGWVPVEKGHGRPGDLIHYTEVDKNPMSMRRVGKKVAGNLIFGKVYQELPIGVKP